MINCKNCGVEVAEAIAANGAKFWIHIGGIHTEVGCGLSAEPSDFVRSPGASEDDADNRGPHFTDWNYADYSAIHDKVIQIARLFQTISGADEKELAHFASTLLANIWPYLRNPKNDAIPVSEMLKRSPLEMSVERSSRDEECPLCHDDPAKDCWGCIPDSSSQNSEK